jgi:hypothetical protein
MMDGLNGDVLLSLETISNLTCLPESPIVRGSSDTTLRGCHASALSSVIYIVLFFFFSHSLSMMGPQHGLHFHIFLIVYS